MISASKMRILHPDQYKLTLLSHGNFKLTDKVVVFYNGERWNIVKLTDMYAYPIIYFNYISHTLNATFINSLVLCPITLRIMIFKGRVEFEKYDNIELHLRHIDTDDIFSMSQPFINTHTHILRRFVKLTSLRNAFTLVSDPIYITVLDRLDYAVDIGYITNNNDMNDKLYVSTYHPKTVVYVVQYYSNNTSEYKHAILVGHDANKYKPTGYDYVKSRLMIYINSYHQKIEEKKAYIFPVFWYLAGMLYPAAKVLRL